VVHFYSNGVEGLRFEVFVARGREGVQRGFKDCNLFASFFSLQASPSDGVIRLRLRLRIRLRLRFRLRLRLRGLGRYLDLTN
jgi:hypothetical protein